MQASLPRLALELQSSWRKGGGVTQTILEYAAFTDAGRGGNPAGVVLDAGALSEPEMLAIAAWLGHSETAFVSPLPGERRVGVRSFSPDAGVPFCGHATVAAAAALASRTGVGDYLVETPVGPIALSTSERDVFDAFTFDASVVRGLMDAHGWTGTVTVLLGAGGGGWEARNLFPVGAITEDPATGSAAASTGAYLRALGEPTPSDLVIRQDRHVGRPSVLQVPVPATGGIEVSGSAAPLGGVR